MRDDDARAALHILVDRICDLVFRPPQDEKPSKPDYGNNDDGSDDGSDWPERPDFRLLPSKRWQVILELVWDDPDAKYKTIALRAQNILGQKVTDKDVASFVFLANKDLYKRQFVHPKRRVQKAN